jgi:hypothetical protein
MLYVTCLGAMCLVLPRCIRLSPWRSCDKETRTQARCTRQRRRRADLPLGFMTAKYTLPCCWLSVTLLGTHRVIAGRGSLYGFCNAREHLDRLGVLGGEVITALLLRWRPTLYCTHHGRRVRSMGIAHASSVLSPLYNYRFSSFSRWTASPCRR